MADSVTPGHLPTGFDLYGAYVDGAYKNYGAVNHLYPGKTVGIAVFSTTNDGIVGDCEAGDMTPLTAVTWVVMRRKAGVDPTIYCSYAAWPSVQHAFTNAGVAQPHYWIAAYPGNGPQLYAGAVAHQWIDHGPYDESVVADYWPGVDATPAPPNAVPPPTQDPRGTKMLHTITIPTDKNGDGWAQTTIPWSTFEAASIGGSDPGADGAYWPGSVLVQDRDSNVLVSVVGCRPLVNVPTFILATA